MPVRALSKPLSPTSPLGLLLAVIRLGLRNGNQGGYSSAEEDSLINATEYGGSAQTFFAYEDYTAEQLPWLWVPPPANDPGVQVAQPGGLRAAESAFTGGLNPEDWYYTSDVVFRLGALPRRSWSLDVRLR